MGDQEEHGKKNRKKKQEVKLMQLQCGVTGIISVT